VKATQGVIPELCVHTNDTAIEIIIPSANLADSPLKRDAVNTYKISHSDDISGLILVWAFALARNEPFDPQEHCQLYHDYWAQITRGRRLEAMTL
jgi:hypothetical protein